MPAGSVSVSVFDATLTAPCSHLGVRRAAACSRQRENTHQAGPSGAWTALVSMFSRWKPKALAPPVASLPTWKLLHQAERSSGLWR